MNARELIQILPDIISIKGYIDVPIESIDYNSKKIKNGAIFVAIPGFNYDGHDFIFEALERGASAVIGEKDLDLGEKLYIRVKDSRKALALSSAWFYEYPADKLKLIGVTGTSGKTTVTYLISEMLKDIGICTGIIGTIGNVLNDRKIPTSHTTPESLELNQLFSKMVEENIKYLAMEVSSHSLKLHRVEGIKFDVGVFTNLTQDHLDFHKTFEDYFNSKKKLFSQSKQAVINIDDESGKRLLNIINIPRWTYGLDKKADLRAENIRITANGVSYDLVFRDKTYPVFYSTPGLFNVYNSLAAITAGVALGFPIDGLINALKKAKGVPGRFELVENNQGIIVIVDYAHKPDGLKNVLLTIREFCTGKVITVFGCGGDRDKGKRPIMGKISSELSDYTIITSDNPRSEKPEAIIEQIESGIIGDNYEKITDRSEAIKKAISIAKKGDAVLIAGKGHETYQIFCDKTIHFDDREVVREYFSKRGYLNEGTNY